MDRTASSAHRTVAVLLLFLAAALPAVAEEEPVQLEESSVIGDQELPVGLEIVPWQPAEPAPAGGTPPQLVTEELAPIDPEVFRRELEIYNSTR